jgi:RNA-directed DNA polymerase
VARARRSTDGTDDGQTARHIEQQRCPAVFLNALRADLKARTFEPLPVRERMIPKAGGMDLPPAAGHLG